MADRMRVTSLIGGTEKDGGPGGSSGRPDRRAPRNHGTHGIHGKKAAKRTKTRVPVLVFLLPCVPCVPWFSSQPGSFQTRTVRSALPESASPPSGEKATLVTTSS